MVGLKEDAFTFNRFALVGERGVADVLLAFVEERDGVEAPGAGVGGVAPDRLLLKGGIGWINILILLLAADSFPLVPVAEDVFATAGALAPEG